MLIKPNEYPFKIGELYRVIKTYPCYDKNSFYLQPGERWENKGRIQDDEIILVLDHKIIKEVSNIGMKRYCVLVLVNGEERTILYRQVNMEHLLDLKNRFELIKTESQ